MAEKGQTIVIKKINITVGAHGGGWKVAFADFMTAMMAFFLVMWLLNQTEDVKKQVASYFSGPSMLEHQFTSYGAELTLEKLFLDMVNEPLGTLQKLMQPADFTPNVLAMGSKKVILHHIANELGPVAKNISIDSDRIEFEIEDIFLFEMGTARLSGQFIDVMEKARALTAGLEDSTVEISSLIYVETVVGENKQLAEQVAAQRLDIIKTYIEESLENESVDVAKGMSKASRDITGNSSKPPGKISFKLIQKESLSDGRKPRKINELFGERDADMSVYNSFVNQLSKKKKSRTPDSVKKSKNFKKKYR